MSIDFQSVFFFFFLQTCSSPSGYQKVGYWFLKLCLSRWSVHTVRSGCLGLKLWRKSAFMFALENYSIRELLNDTQYMCQLLCQRFILHHFFQEWRNHCSATTCFCEWHSLKDFVCFCRLEEGRYLIAHKSGEPFVTILKAAHGKGNRGGYDLHQAHSSVPQPPAFGFVPWIPVDPAVVLPFHQQHGRVPCTFPPAPIVKVCIHVVATVTLLIQNIIGEKHLHNNRHVAQVNKEQQEERLLCLY